MYCSVFASVHPPIVSNYLANLSTEPIYLSSQPIHPSVFPSNYLSFPLSIHVSIELPISRVVHLLVIFHPSIFPSMRLSVFVSIPLPPPSDSLFVYLCIFLPTHPLSIYVSCPCAYLSMCLPLCCFYPSLSLSIRPSFYASILSIVSSCSSVRLLSTSRVSLLAFLSTYLLMDPSIYLSILSSVKNEAFLRGLLNNCKLNKASL